MKLVHWVRFTWDLEQLSPLQPVLPEHYHFAAASAVDEKELRTMIGRCFVQDTSWGDAIHEIRGMIDGWMERAFVPEGGGIYVALRHGLRIIGASILLPDPAMEDQLAPGPCVLMEYRNRGFGTALLEESLRQLQATGLATSSTLTKSNASVAKSLYRKFSSSSTPVELPALAV